MAHLKVADFYIWLDVTPRFQMPKKEYATASINR
jgi:hypothetical protein